MTTPTNNQTTPKSALFGTPQAPAVPTAPAAPSVPAAPTFQQDVYTPTAPTTVAPQTTGLGSVINGLFNAVGKIFSGVFGFLKRLFNVPAGAAAPTVPPTPTVPGATTTPALPAAPTVPTTPTVPGTPAANNTTAPTVPAVPATPTTPTDTPPVVTVPPVAPPTLPTEPPVLAPPLAPEPPTMPAPPAMPPAPPVPTMPEPPAMPPVVSVPPAPEMPAPPVVPPTPATPVLPTTPTTPGGELNAEEAAIAQQQGIQATRANFDAFIAEAKKLETQNAIGPGSTETAAVQELQTLLAGWGYPVTPSGQFDQATIDAVLKFKRDNNLTSPYVMADGTPGVHPFIDDACKTAMVAKLQGAAPAAPATPTPAATPTPTPTVPATPATPAAPATGTLTAEESAIAQQQGILATKPNFDAFIAEAKSLETQNALGPGTTDTAAVQELQTLLTSWGYPVSVTGQFDQTTIDAVLKFKRDNNLSAAYQMADGTPGVHPFIDDKVKAAMIAKLQGTAPATATPAPAATPVPATVTTPQFQAPVSSAPLSAEEAAIAQQQGIEPSRANFDAFMGEARTLEAQNALGPGTTETTKVTELQQVLTQFGYAVTVTGQFDQATIDAVLKFKRDNNVAAPYKMADGTPGLHPFIDDRTKAVMIQKLGG